MDSFDKDLVTKYQVKFIDFEWKIIFLFKNIIIINTNIEKYLELFIYIIENYKYSPIRTFFQ